MDYEIFDRAVRFAVDAHAGSLRKGSGVPYILHPLEVAAIAGTLTDDPEVLSAAVLHDTVEDTPVTIEEIRENFGERVAALVAAETENKRPGIPPDESWQIRKDESLAELENSGDDGVAVMWLADKLSNMRSFYRLYEKKGNDLWKDFHQGDPAKQAEYYRRVAELTENLSHSVAWKEYVTLVDRIFEGTEGN